MRHVWILNHYAKHPDAAGGARHFQLARHLPAHGWHATLIASSVDHPSGEQRLEKGEPWRLETIDGVNFLWLRTSSYRGNGGGRMKNMLEYAWQAMRPTRLAELERPDLIVGSSVHPFAALAGWWLARRHRVPFVFEVRDLWPQTLIDMGRLREGAALTRAMRRLETFLYRRARRVLTLLPRAVDYIAPLGVPEERVVWLSNGVDLAAFPEPDAPAPRPPEMPLSLMYFGSHGEANGLADLLEAMAIVKADSRAGEVPVQLRLIGDGPGKRELMRQASGLGLDGRWVRFEPPVPKREIPALASEADAFVITVRDLPRLYRFGISMNKLFDYMAAARPVIIASAAVNDPVAEAGAGITVPPEDPLALAEAIKRLAALPPDERARMGRAGRAHVEAVYDYRILAERLAGIMNDVMDERQ
ncbi:glycosyltransferase family 4 protein [Halomonas sp. MCCC 1A17488]|uniref:glycosyltransferase family 4 protein n=1 Tax=unclassified Halomonas TaxID=2609666 RepID=UPI0018D25863|nr:MULTISPECIES: glycosyltransferase family 4 protein [unclassified Halomonas]MCE8015063.1 glycosyltransferase family 4 protein [Halomonas sp. MCCC 1A17488]MCG3238396.1 glycosyltransferase family 4 protein [Halomonas sp. MCCC 1A17488]QPP47861.1 glycosyltransferase family 4 protein [Halomonas sp. SS10-MC5]